ncbi:MAG: lysostaphin resistance A-like protein [Balneolaceae bacterium]
MNVTDGDFPAEKRPESWASKNGFAHWAMALIWILFAFMLFQGIATLVMMAVFTATGNAQAMTTMAGMMDHLNLVFIGNSVGQIVGLGLATLAVVGLSTASESRFSFIRLRWRPRTIKDVAIAVALTITIYPVVILLGYLNQLLPIPEFFTQIQESQYESILGYLQSEGTLLLALFHVAMVPAFAEEILFRGYAQRSFEKSWGVAASVILSGVLFSFFHVQLGNVLPLATLGMLFAALTVLTGSLWPAIFAHFANNASAVLLTRFYPDLAESTVGTETLPPWHLIILSIIVTGLLLLYLIRNYQTEAP